MERTVWHRADLSRRRGSHQGPGRLGDSTCRLGGRWAPLPHHAAAPPPQPRGAACSAPAPQRRALGGGGRYRRAPATWSMDMNGGWGVVGGRRQRARRSRRPFSLVQWWKHCCLPLHGSCMSLLAGGAPGIVLSGMGPGAPEKWDRFGSGCVGGGLAAPCAARLLPRAPATTRDPRGAATQPLAPWSHKESIDIGSAGKGCASGGRQSKSNGRGVAGCGTARSLRGRCPRAACRFLLGGR